MLNAAKWQQFEEHILLCRFQLDKSLYIFKYATTLSLKTLMFSDNFCIPFDAVLNLLLKQRLQITKNRST